jgi:hypothetical protein
MRILTLLSFDLIDLFASAMSLDMGIICRALSIVMPPYLDAAAPVYAVK